ncbi:unnamed protein product, partial [Didymodactylos carnosus]
MEPFMTIMVAMDENNGIGLNNILPWCLPGDWNWFLTISTNTIDPKKRNAVIFGRLSYESLLKQDRSPLKHWHTIVISSNPEAIKQQSSETSVTVVPTFERAAQYSYDMFHNADQNIENVYVLGGVQVYDQAVKLKLVKRIY